MSTRCLIGVLINAEVRYIYCHHDGGNYVQNILAKNYDYEKVQKLFEKGDISTLGKVPEESKFCVDNGERKQAVMPTLEDVGIYTNYEYSICGEEFRYYFDKDNTLYCIDLNGKKYLKLNNIDEEGKLHWECIEETPTGLLDFKRVIFRGKPIYVKDERVKKEDKLEGYKYYELRHSDDDWSEPVSLDDKVLVNFWGTVVSKEPINLDDNWAKGRYSTTLTQKEIDEITTNMWG